MKRIILILFAIGITAMSSVSMAAMSNSRVRKETRFLTDKMAYELNLNTASIMMSTRSISILSIPSAI